VTPRKRLRVIFENADDRQSHAKISSCAVLANISAPARGGALLRFADLTEAADLIESARTEAEALLAGHPGSAKGISSAGSAGVPIFSMPEA